MTLKQIRTCLARTTAAGAALGALSMAANAGADPLCTSYPNPVFVAGTSAAKSALQAIAKQLPGISIIYQTPDSCIALADLTAGLPAIAPKGATVTTNLLAFDGTQPSCVLSPGAQDPAEVVNIAVSDVVPATCDKYLGTGGIISGQQIDVFGPIQAQTIDVPFASQAKSISAEAAYVVFRFADYTYGVPPWNVAGDTGNLHIFIRPFTSGTTNIIGTAIGLPGTLWRDSGDLTNSRVESSSLNIYNAIANVTTNVDQTIGILSSQFVLQQNAKNVADGGTGLTIRTLPFQQKGQTCGYFPDATENTGDKLNVRQGRYAIWGPAHLAANVGGDGNPNGVHAAAVTAVLNAFIATGCEGMNCPTGSNKLLGGADAGSYFGPDAGTSVDTLKKAVIDAEASVAAGGVIPWCAMEVMRNAEIGTELPYAPTAPCGCYFEAKASGKTRSAYCKGCAIDADCVGDASTSAYPKCRYGYCEVR
jgi:hypothetical protein